MIIEAHTMKPAIQRITPIYAIEIKIAITNAATI